MPQNICEYFFYNEAGVLQIYEEQVKTLQSEFAELIRHIYGNATKKYEEIIQGVVTDTDLEQLDFPMIAKPFQVEPFMSLLSPDLAAKLNLEPEKVDEKE